MLWEMKACWNPFLAGILATRVLVSYSLTQFLLVNDFNMVF